MKKRAEELFTLPFFKRFSIVIIACGAPYQRQFDAEHKICAIWNVTWSGETVDVLSERGKRGNFYNDHRGKTSDEQDKIVIHTRQMSNGVSNTLIDKTPPCVAHSMKPLRNSFAYIASLTEVEGTHLHGK